MTPDELNRKMEFIVEQQAQFATDIQVLKERQEQFQGQIEALKAVAETALETSTRTMEIVTALSEGQGKLAEAQARTQRQMARLARLFERHVVEGHGPATP